MHVERRGHGLRVALATLALGGLAFVWLGASGVRQMIYPAPALAVGEPPPGSREVWLEPAGGDRVHGWHRSAGAATRPAVLFLHGNGENLETMRRGGLFAELDALGAHSLAIDYPGYGRSGAQPSEAALVAAADAAISWLGEEHPESPIVVCGWSLGAAVGVAAAAARSDDVAGLVALSAWSELAAVARLHFPGFLVGLLLSERYDSVAAAGRFDGPALVVHGAADRIIPAEQGRQVAAALAGGRWVEVAGAGHNDLLARAAVWEEIRGFVNELARE